MKLDNVDRKLVEELEKDSSKPLKEIARELSIPLTTAHYRKKRLEEIGVVRRYRAVVDRKALGFGFMLLVFGKSGGVELSPGGRIESVMKIKTAEWDIAVLARARDETDASELLGELRRKGIKEMSPIYIEEILE